LSEQELKIYSKFDLQEKLINDTFTNITAYISDLKIKTLKQMQTEKDDTMKEFGILREKLTSVVATERSIRTNIISAYQKEIEYMKAQKHDIERDMIELKASKLITSSHDLSQL
jgi:cupin superfamily acireductone dioxygenase involved in methionine salvage